MPTVKNIEGPYRVFFYSFDRHEPKHVHMEENIGRIMEAWHEHCGEDR